MLKCVQLIRSDLKICYKNLLPFFLTLCSARVSSASLWIEATDKRLHANESLVKERRENKPLWESGYLRFSVLQRETVESSWGHPVEQNPAPCHYRYTRYTFSQHCFEQIQTRFGSSWYRVKRSRSFFKHLFTLFVEIKFKSHLAYLYTTW